MNSIFNESVNYFEAEAVTFQINRIFFFYVNSTSQTFKYSLNYFKYVKHADWKNKALIYFKELQNHWAGTVQSQSFSELAEIR